MWLSVSSKSLVGTRFRIENEIKGWLQDSISVYLQLVILHPPVCMWGKIWCIQWPCLFVCLFGFLCNNSHKKLTRAVKSVSVKSSHTGTVVAAWKICAVSELTAVTVVHSTLINIWNTYTQPLNVAKVNKFAQNVIFVTVDQ